VQDLQGTLPRRVSKRWNLTQAVAFKTMAIGADGGKNFVRSSLARLDTPRHIKQLAHVCLATADKVGQVEAIAFIQKFVVAMVGILQDCHNGSGIGILLATDADKAVLPLVVPAMAFHAAPSVRRGYPYLLGFEGRVGLIGCAGLELKAQVVVETTSTNHRCGVTGGACQWCRESGQQGDQCGKHRSFHSLLPSSFSAHHKKYSMVICIFTEKSDFPT